MRCSANISAGQPGLWKGAIMASSEATTPTGIHAPEGTRRDFLYIATGTVAAVGAAAVLVPLIAQMNPDASTLAAGGPVDLDVSKIAPGQQVVIRWRERPIFVFHRTPETLQDAARPQIAVASCPIRIPSRSSSRPTRPTPPARSSRNSACWSAFAPISAASRCSIRSPARPRRSADWLGGYFCPCHGSKYDPAGRVFSGVPAPYNLPVPPYTFVSDTTHPGRRESERHRLGFRLDPAALSAARALAWDETPTAAEAWAGAAIAAGDCRRRDYRIRRRRLSRPDRSHPQPRLSRLVLVRLRRQRLHAAESVGRVHYCRSGHRRADRHLSDHQVRARKHAGTACPR